MQIFATFLVLLCALLISAVIDQVVPKLSSPLIQIALGVVIALFAPSGIGIHLDPDLFLVLFVAPILYDEARDADKSALWENRRAMVSLAVGLVFLTIIAVGFTVNWLVPSIPLAAAIALGAALGPTDAVAVSSLPEDVNLGERRRNILKGEYLINDASGIVAFQFAIIFAITGTFDAGNILVTFLICFFGGILIGFALGLVANWILGFVRSIGLETTTFYVLFDLACPFIIYLAAEHIGASGIIAVVVAGFVRSFAQGDVAPVASRLSIVSTSVWRVLTFALNGIVFILLGTQLPNAMQDTWGDITISNLELVGYIVLITAIIFGVRFLWILVQEHLSSQHETDDKLFSKTNAYSALLMTLAAPKGAVTLSIMLTTPYFLTSGSAFPQRDLIIFLACGVICLTLLISNFAVPFFAPKHTMSDNEEAEHEAEIEANIAILRTVIEELSAQVTPSNRRATQRVVHIYNDRIERIKSQNDIQDKPNIELRLKAYEWEREKVEELLEAGEVDPEIAEKRLARIDNTMKRLRNYTERWGVRRFLQDKFTTAYFGTQNMFSKLPGVNLPEKNEEMRKLRHVCNKYVVEKLREEVAADNVPTEDASRLILDYQRSSGLLRNKGTDPSLITPRENKVAEIQSKALSIELATIQNMYEEGAITYSMALHFRENISLMRTDLGDSL